MKATEENNISTGSPLLRISKSLFFVTILLMPFFRPSGINYILPGGQYVYDAFSMASLGILVIIYLSGEKQLIDWQIILSGLMFLVIMFSTIRNHGDTMVHLRVTAACFGIMLGVSDLRKTPKLLMLAPLDPLGVELMRPPTPRLFWSGFVDSVALPDVLSTFSTSGVATPSLQR